MYPETNIGVGGAILIFSIIGILFFLAANWLMNQVDKGFGTGDYYNKNTKCKQYNTYNQPPVNTTTYIPKRYIAPRKPPCATFFERTDGQDLEITGDPEDRFLAEWERDKLKGKSVEQKNIYLQQQIDILDKKLKLLTQKEMTATKKPN